MCLQPYKYGLLIIDIYIYIIYSNNISLRILSETVHVNACNNTLITHPCKYMCLLCIHMYTEMHRQIYCLHYLQQDKEFCEVIPSRPFTWHDSKSRLALIMEKALYGAGQ